MSKLLIAVTATILLTAPSLAAAATTALQLRGKGVQMPAKRPAPASRGRSRVLTRS